jgi:hypothetical protein
MSSGFSREYHQLSSASLQHWASLTSATAWISSTSSTVIRAPCCLSCSPLISCNSLVLNQMLASSWSCDSNSNDSCPASLQWQSCLASDCMILYQSIFHSINLAYSTWSEPAKPWTWHLVLSGLNFLAPTQPIQSATQMWLLENDVCRVTVTVPHDLKFMFTFMHF